MNIEIIDTDTLTAVKAKKEGQYLDFKSKRIQPMKALQTLCAFANADGGEIYIGIEDPSVGWNWDGFSDVEQANGLIQAFEEVFPLGDGLVYSFLRSPSEPGLVLHVEVKKAKAILTGPRDKVYVRRGAASRTVQNETEMQRLRLNKGIESFEDQTINTSTSRVSESEILAAFLEFLVPSRAPLAWLRKQELLDGGLPTLAGVLLFDEEPQSVLSRASVKIYRYKTTDVEGSRDTLAGVPITVEGCAYDQIYEAVDKVVSISSSIPLLGEAGMEAVEFPRTALHEVIANAILHRDYSIDDSVHIRIFDNRMEIESPGTLPAHVTVQNILKTRAVRNQKLTRLINKFENPPNMDVGEGLNTCFQEIRKLRLKPPSIAQLDNSVLVLLRHERLGSSEEAIINFLKSNTAITNGVARELCAINDTNKMKRVLQSMVKAGVLEPIEGRAKKNAAYRRGENYDENFKSEEGE